ncbi:MAG: acyloxyacyl hydrolase [Planctomycetota bacterium]|nr:acyloxyacyl hydrolase [Planctomycetota bacterium]
MNGHRFARHMIRPLGIAAAATASLRASAAEQGQGPIDVLTLYALQPAVASAPPSSSDSALIAPAASDAAKPAALPSAPPVEASAPPIESSAPTTLQAATSTTPRFGAKDSWRVNLEGEWMTDFQDANDVQARIGVAWFFVENAELALYGSGGYVSQPGQDAGTYGMDLEVRWHFLARETWSLFGSIGCGVMGSTSSVPSDGSEFNFTPSIGAGATIEVAENTRLYMSARWDHISNAQTYADNPGRDNLGVWLGLSFGM